MSTKRKGDLFGADITKYSGKRQRVGIKPRPRSRSLDSLGDSDGSTTKETSSHDSTTYFTSQTPRSFRQRSASIDSVPDSVVSLPMGLPSRSRSINGRRQDTMKSVASAPLLYHPFRDELKETKDLHVPGESKCGGEGRPVRHLDSFTFYNPDGTYLPYTLVASRILSGTRRHIHASGLVSPCLEDEVDGDSDVTEAETEILVSLQPLEDFWVDYDSGSSENVWIATSHAWYILGGPAPLYKTFYQPFWAAHHLMWLIVKAVRQDHNISLDNFCQQLHYEKDDEAMLVMGRRLAEKDLDDYVILYIMDQLSSLGDSETLLRTPLIKHLASYATNIGETLEELSNLENWYKPDSSEPDETDPEYLDSPPKPDRRAVTHGQTVTMPIVHELTTGIFLKTLLKAGKTLDNQDGCHKLLQAPDPPNILHPDRPTHVEWENPAAIHGYFHTVSLDGENYSVGNVVMINPGEDDLVHRAKSALETCSQSQRNELVNRVWFGKIVYMYDKPVSSKAPKPVPTAHVQWYEHGSKTILQETAHPYELFALAECADIPVGAILGSCAVKHIKPSDEKPWDYHCSFLWDADEVRFLDQSILAKHTNPDERHAHCPCCAFNKEREQDTNHEVLIHSESHATVRGIEYHTHDFVYIAAVSNRPYYIGQVRRFVISKTLTVADSRVELTRLGRFDDVVRDTRASHVKKDEMRLFMTEEVGSYALHLLEGKCFIVGKNELADLADHFYVDRWARRVRIHDLNELLPLPSDIAECEGCLRDAACKKEDELLYLESNPPLKTMELFAGAGGLSTGLEQSKFVKTRWAVEILPGAAATFQANHPDAIVYNQDTNICLQNAIDIREGKPCKPLCSISDRTVLPPMPQRGEVELITGGFPCQSFSGMNHLRHKRPDDIRTTLVANMLSYVEFYEPRYVLMENVKGLLQHHSQGYGLDEDDEDGDKIIKMVIVKFVLRALTCLGYQTQFRVLQAADYGSPQRRERVIFWGARRSQVLPNYPLPTHVAPNHKNPTLSLPTHDKLIPMRHSDMNCAPFMALVVADAISDLPAFDWKNPHFVLSEDEAKDAEGQRQRIRHREVSAVSTPTRTLTGFLGPVEYARTARTRYQRLLRGDETQVTLHCSRTFCPPVVERVWHVCSPDVSGPHDIPRELWTPALIKVSKDKSKLDRKWQESFTRLEWEEPFNTALTACRPFTKAYRVLHPKQRRIITARECARSQGFPDSYEFVQKDDDGRPADWAKLLNDIHKQIGNAVPVPLARALGNSLGKALITRQEENH